MVNKFLNLFFGKCSVCQVSLCINIQECGCTSQRHGRAILLLDGSQIAKIQPLDCFLYILCRSGNIKSVNLTKFFQFFQSFNLFGQFFPCSGNVRIHNNSGRIFLMLLVLNQTVNTIQCHTTIVSDNSSTAVCVRKSGNNVAGTARSHFRCVSIENTLIMSFSVFGEELNNLRIHMISIVFTCFHRHTDTAVRLQRTFERFVSLKTNDCLFFFVQITGTMRSDCGNNFGVHIQHTAFFSLLSGKIHNLFPKFFCVFCGICQKSIISVIRSVVFLNEISDIDLFFPDTRAEAFPLFSHYQTS